jgi:hypothetical protein
MASKSKSFTKTPSGFLVCKDLKNTSPRCYR